MADVTNQTPPAADPTAAAAPTQAADPKPADPTPAAPKEDAPSKEELAAYRKWQESQQSEAEKQAAAISKAEKAKADAETKALALENRLTAVSKGIPADKADRYCKLAETYMDDKTDFAHALELAVKDFPVTPGNAARTPFIPPNPAAASEAADSPNGAMNALIRGRK